MLSLIKNELYKALRLKKLYLFLFIITAIEIAAIFQYKLRPNDYLFVYVSGQSFPIALLESLTQIIAIFVAVFQSDMIIDEYRNGTFKLVLLRPVSRVEFINAKIISLLLFIGGLIGYTIISSYIVGTMAFGWGDKALLNGIVYPSIKGIGITFQSAFITLLPCLTFGIMVLFIAILTDNIGITIGSALALMILSSVIDNLGTMRNYSIIYLMGSFYKKFLYSSTPQEIYTNMLTIALYIVVFYLGSVYILKNKDILL